MRTRVIALSAIFYLAVGALLLGVLFELWSDVLPNALSVRIGHNTEGYILALVVAAWIQFVRARIAGSRAEWIITAIAVLAFVGLTIYLLAGHGVASRFKTLNEGTLAAALLIPYVQLRRPLPRLAAAVAALVIVAVTIVTNKSAETTDMAETFGMIILAILGLDVVDRGILDPTAKTSPMLRWCWYGALIVAPVIFSLAEYHWGAGTTGVLGTTVRFLVRITEAFIFALFVEVFFAVGLGRTGAPARASRVELTESTTATPAPTM